MPGQRILAIDIGDSVEFPSTMLQANAVRSLAAGFYRTITRTTGGNPQSGYSRLNWRDTGRVYLRWRVTTVAGNGIMLGVVKTSEATAATYLGNTAASWSYWTLGQVIHGGALTAVTASVSGDYVEMAWDGQTGSLWFGRNGVWFNSGDPANGLNPTYSGVTGALDLAVTIYGQGSAVTLMPDEADCRATCPAGFTPAGILARVASKGFATDPADNPPSVYYDGCIASDGDPEYTREVTCVVWDRGQGARGPLGDIELINIDGALDFWANYDLARMPVRLRIGYEGQLLTAFADAAAALIDRAEDINDERLRLVLADPGARNNVPLAVSMFSATPNTALVNTPAPYVLGNIKWTSPPQSDPANLEYPVHDGVNAGVYEVRDQGVVITPSTGWSFGVRTDAAGIRRLTNPAGRNVVAVRGAATLGLFAQNWDFTVAGGWSGDNPTGWSLGFTEDANNKITFNGGAQFLCNGAGPVVIMERGTGAWGSNPTLGMGKYYWCEIVATIVGGQLEVQTQGPGATDLNQTTIAVMKSSGTLRFGLSCLATTSLRLAINKAAGGNLTVQTFKLWEVALIERLPAVLTELCVTRGRLFAKDLDLAGTIASVDAAFPAKFGFYADQSAVINDLVKAICDSIVGWYWHDRKGQLRVGRLLDPANQQAIAFFDETNIIGPLQRMRDRAPGLSDNVAGRRNWSPHGAGELAGSVLTTSTAGDLQANYLTTKTGVGAFAASYVAAVGRKALETLLTVDADVQSIATLLKVLFAKDRFFYVFTGVMDDTPPATNLLLRSQAFQQSPWLASSVAITDNVALSPLGQYTAATISDSTTLVMGSAYQTMTVPADTTAYTASIYVAKTAGGTSTTFGITLGISGGTAVSATARVDTDTGALLTGAASAKVQDADTYWRVLVSVTNNGTANNTTLRLDVIPAAAGHGSGVDAASAKGTATVWGGQVETGLNASPYIWTTTAAAMAPRSYTLEPSDVVSVATNLTKRFGLATGRNLLLISAKGRFLSNQVDMIAWG